MDDQQIAQQAFSKEGAEHGWARTANVKIIVLTIGNKLSGCIIFLSLLATALILFGPWA